MMKTEEEDLLEEKATKGSGDRMKVMVGMDGSDGSIRALTWALETLFKPGSSVAASITLLHVQEPFFYPKGPAVYMTPSAMEVVRKEQDANSASMVTMARDLCKQKSAQVEVGSVIMVGEPKEAMCRAAEQFRADLLVMGSHGKGMIKRALLGSVSDYCAHHVRCPVVIVKRRKRSDVTRESVSV
ncbi:hypothetical protein QJS04_geneDACA012963 [Acorus gramineus]|uniref:UspA domain-containing protein n=1 Tax=Acorus gramineus TaxID=55184 RepID=A0AAV9B2U5_ACOGR|nr:hypothetical protein QJS04_geneDACA012963 [Acorus gramineus]